MTSIHVDLDSIEWTPGSAYKGPDGLYQDQEVFYRKVLSDRRQEGGGLAVLSKICPPPGKMVKTVVVARSEEHIFNLRGGRVNKSGKTIEAPGNGYTLNPTGQPHSAMIATENITGDLLRRNRRRQIGRDRRFRAGTRGGGINSRSGDDFWKPALWSSWKKGTTLGGTIVLKTTSAPFEMIFSTVSPYSTRSIG